MRRPLPLLVLILACLGCGMRVMAATSQTMQKCVPEVYDTIDLTVTDNVYVPVEINGHAGVMSLDLASPTSYLEESQAGRAGFVIASAALADTSGRRATIKVGHFRSLRVGEADFGSGNLRVRSGQAVANAAGRDLLGVLGSDFLADFDFELDLSRRRLNLFTPGRCVGNPVYWADQWGTAPLMSGANGTVYFPAELDREKVEAILTLAQPTTQVRADLTKRLFAARSQSKTMNLTGVGMQLEDVRFTLTDPPAASCLLLTSGRAGGGAGYSGCGDVYPVAFGRDVLSRVRLFFEMKQRTVYFTRENATIKR